MSDYRQPGFYRFNRDSLALVAHVTSKVVSPHHILDLGAGCGIIGIELARHFHPESLALVELQEEFRPFIETNLQEFLPPKVAGQVSFQCFSKWRGGEYDLIVTNPPYYLQGHGELPRDRRRALARTLIDVSWTELLTTIDESLAHEGRAFVVLKRDELLLNHVREAIRKTPLSHAVVEFDDLVFLELF